MTDGYNILKQCMSKNYPERSCGKFKLLDQFYTRQTLCKSCHNDVGKQYYKDNKQNLKLSQKIYQEEHKEELSEYYKQYREENKEHIKEIKHKYYEENKEELQVYNKQYREEHKEELSEYKKQYFQENKDFLKEYKRQYYEENKEEIVLKKYAQRKERRKVDLAFAMRLDVGRAVNYGIKMSGGSKQGHSILQYLPWNFVDLRNHLESLFTHLDSLTPDGYVWMTRENRGIFNIKTWNDNDPSTWTWQIDHIIPHSTFHYTTMDCQEFRDCWDLSNLRPLSAKQNFLDGIFRTRHKKVS